MRRGLAALVLAAAPLLGAAPAAHGAAAPAAAWSFDEGAAVAGAQTAAAGRFGHALALRAGVAADLGAIPRLQGAGALTLEAWVRPAAVGRRRHAVRIAGLPPALTADGRLPLNSWSHLASTYDGTAVRSYVDGELVSAVARPGLTAGGAVRLGGGRFSGLIDELRIYDRALSSSEITADRDTPIASPGLLTRPGAGAGKPHDAGGHRRARLIARAF
jgi:hypothetical protein